MNWWVLKTERILFDWVYETVIQSKSWNHFGWYLIKHSIIMHFIAVYYSHHIRMLTTATEHYYPYNCLAGITQLSLQSLSMLFAFGEYLSAILSNPLKSLTAPGFMDQCSSHYWPSWFYDWWSCQLCGRICCSGWLMFNCWATRSSAADFGLLIFSLLRMDLWNGYWIRFHFTGRLHSLESFLALNEASFIFSFHFSFYFLFPYTWGSTSFQILLFQFQIIMTALNILFQFYILLIFKFT